MAINRSKLVILFLIVAILTYTGLIYLSASNADFQITASLTEKIDFQKINEEKTFPLKFNLDVTGIGLISSTAEDLFAEIYLEEIYVGTLESTRDIVDIPASSSETVYLRFIQDTATISDSDFRHIQNKIEEHNGEIKVDVVGDIKPKVLFYSLNKEISSSSYLLEAGKPVIGKLA